MEYAERILAVRQTGERRANYDCCRRRLYAGEPTALRCWKHSLQNTGRPCVGRKGTVVSFPQFEQVVLVSERCALPFWPWPGL